MFGCHNIDESAGQSRAYELECELVAAALRLIGEHERAGGVTAKGIADVESAIEAVREYERRDNWEPSDREIYGQ